MVVEADLMAMLDEQSDVAMEWLACDSVSRFSDGPWIRPEPCWNAEPLVIFAALADEGARSLRDASR